MKAPILRKEILAPGMGPHGRLRHRKSQLMPPPVNSSFCVRTDRGERIPLTISDFDPAAGTVSIVYQVVGGTTLLLDSLSIGERVCLPLPVLWDVPATSKAIAMLPSSAGVWAAPSPCRPLQPGTVKGAVSLPLPVSAAESRSFWNGQLTDSSDRFLLCGTDDGSAGEGVFVTGALEQLLQAGERFDMVFAIGRLPGLTQAVS